MSDTSIEINTVSHKIDIETSSNNLTNSVTVETESPENIDVLSGYISVADVDDITGLENYVVNFFTSRLLPVSGLDKQFETATSTFNIGVSGIYVDQINELTTSASEINYLDLSFGAGTAEANKALVLDNDTSITGINFISTTGDMSVGNDLHINGDFTVAGTTTTVHSTDVNIGDNVITVNTEGLSVGGFRIYDGADYQTLLWTDTNSRWEFGNNKDVFIGGKIISDRIGIGTSSPTQKLDVNSSGIRIRDDHTPASASAPGNKGDIVWDSNYVYICIDTDTWKRSVLSTW